MFTNPGRSLMHNIYPMTLGQRLGLPDNQSELPILKALERIKKEEENKQPKPADNILPVGQLNIAPIADVSADNTNDNCEEREMEQRAENEENKSMLDMLAEM